MGKFNKPEDVKDFVLEAERNGNVVVLGIEGLMQMPIKNFITQPTEGILYDLNRAPEVILTFIDDPKWVNDYAVQLVIKELKNKIYTLQEQVDLQVPKEALEDMKKKLEYMITDEENLLEIYAQINSLIKEAQKIIFKSSINKENRVKDEQVS
jgi:hypothetical protein